MRFCSQSDAVTALQAGRGGEGRGGGCSRRPARAAGSAPAGQRHRHLRGGDSGDLRGVVFVDGRPRGRGQRERLTFFLRVLVPAARGHARLRGTRGVDLLLLPHLKDAACPISTG